MAYTGYYTLSPGGTRVKFMDTEDDSTTSIAVLSCTITLSVGESGESVIKVPPSNVFSVALDDRTAKAYKCWIYLYKDSNLIFEGRLMPSLKKDFYNNYEATFIGLMDMLNDIYIIPGNYSSERNTEEDDVTTTVTQIEYVGNLIYYYNQQQTNTAQKVTWDGVTGTTEQLQFWNYRYQHDLDTFETALTRIQDVVDSCGGYLKFENQHLSVFFPNTTQGQTIDFGTNLLTLKQTQDVKTFATRVIPLGKRVSTDTSSSDATTQRHLDISSVTEGGVPWIQNDAAIAQYGIISKTITNESLDDATTLMSWGETELASYLTPKVQISATAVNLKNAGFNVDDFVTGENVIVNSAAHGLSGLVTLVKKLSLNPLQPTQEKLVLDNTIDGYIGSSFSRQRTMDGDITALYTDPDSVKKLRDDVADLTEKYEETVQQLIEYENGFGSRVSTYIGTKVTGTYSAKSSAYVYYKGSGFTDFDMNYTVNPNRSVATFKTYLDAQTTPSTTPLTVRFTNKYDTSQYQDVTYTAEGTEYNVDVSNWTTGSSDTLYTFTVSYTSGSTTVDWAIAGYIEYTYTAEGLDYADSTIQKLSTEIKQTSDSITGVTTDINGLHDYLTWGDGKLTIMKDGSGIYSEQTNQGLSYKYGTGEATDSSLMELTSEGVDIDTVKVESHLDFRYGGEGTASGTDQWSIRHGEAIDGKMNLNLVYIGGSM